MTGGFVVVLMELPVKEDTFFSPLLAMFLFSRVNHRVIRFNTLVVSIIRMFAVLIGS